MDIKNITRLLKKKYNTSDPYEIARQKGIIIIYEQLGSINGYYNMIYRQKQIHINCNLDEREKLITVAHELGHAIMHPKANTPFLKNNTLFSVDKLEIEANKFAAELLINDGDIQNYSGYTIEQIACMLNLSKELVNIKFYGLNK